jgi:hypothetical protein
MANEAHNSTERQALKVLLRTVSLEASLIQADALYTIHAVVAGPSSKAPTSP